VAAATGKSTKKGVASELKEKEIVYKKDECG